VVPHGTGIGDAVTARPLLEAIVEHEDRGQVFVLLPAHLAWLLPPGAAPAPQRLLSRLWQWMAPDSRAAVLLRRLSARQTARLAHPAVIRAAALGLTSLLEFEGYEVINLLEYFSQLDLHRRWTAGSWSRDRRHVIDLLADRLQERSITVPAQRRVPTLRLVPLPLDCAPAVIPNPNAGSTLKEPPAGFWVGVVAALRRSSIRPFVLAAPGRGMARDIVQEAPGSILLEETSCPELPRVSPAPISSLARTAGFCTWPQPPARVSLACSAPPIRSSSVPTARTEASCCRQPYGTARCVAGAGRRSSCRQRVAPSLMPTTVSPASIQSGWSTPRWHSCANRWESTGR